MRLTPRADAGLATWPSGLKNPAPFRSAAANLALRTLAEATPLICGHSGGDWELGVRAIRPYRNIFLEFAGSDPHSGMVDYAIRELGVDRLIWGGHGPSRSYATEMGKVLDADISKRIE